MGSAQTIPNAPIFGGQSVRQIYHQAVATHNAQGNHEGFQCGNDYNNAALIPASSPCFEVTQGYGSNCWSPTSGGSNNVDPACQVAAVPFPAKNGGKYQVPIQIVIFEDSNWTGANYLNGTGFLGLTNIDIDAKIASINAIYGNAEIEFYECVTRKRVQNPDLFDFYQNNDPFTGENDGNGDLTQTSLYDLPNVINIYFTSGIEGDHDCCGIMGFAPYPPSRDFIIMRYGTAIGGTTFDHELGHYFGLHHTHKAGPNLSSGDVYGFPDGNIHNCDCKTTGDGICDTWPDPNFSYQCGSNCWGLDVYCFISDVFPRCDFDSAGFACVATANNSPATSLPLNPNHGVNSGNGTSTILTENIMSYNLYGGCRQAFSPCQFKKINDVLRSCRSYLCSSQPDRYFSSNVPGDVNAPYQEICVGDLAPTFFAIFPGSNSPAFNWYAEESSTTPLSISTASFTPTIGTGSGQLDNMTPGTYSFYLEDVNSYGDCKMRVEVVVQPSAGPGTSAGGSDSLSLCGQTNLLLQANSSAIASNETVGWWLTTSPLSFSNQQDLNLQLSNATLGGSISQNTLNHIFPSTVNKNELSLAVDCSQLITGQVYYATPVVSKDNIAAPAGYSVGTQTLNDYSGGNPGITEISIPVFQLPSHANLDQVCIDLSHIVMNDLIFELIAPDLTVIPLSTFFPFTYPSGDFDACYVDDGTGINPMLGCNGSASCYTGTVESVAPFSMYQGDPNGIWKLRITDQNNAGFGGTLTEASLVFDQQPIALSFPDIDLSSCTIGESIKFGCDCGANGGNITNLMASHPSDSSLAYSQLDINWTAPTTVPDGYLIQYSDNNGLTWNSPTTHPWINEIHYENMGTDINEGIEIAGPAGVDLGCYKIYLYDGATGNLNGAPISLTGSLSNETLGYGTKWIPINGLQNSVEGIALVYEGNGDCQCSGSQHVVEVLTYEGTFTCQNGPATGMTGTMLPVAEVPGTQVGYSLQRTGCGHDGPGFTWVAPTTHSRDLLNNTQSVYTLDGVASSFSLTNLSSCSNYLLRIAPMSCSSGAGTFVSTVSSIATYSPDLTYLLTAPASVCDGNGTTAQLGQSQAGFTYQLRDINSQSIGQVIPSTGGPLTFNIPSSALPAQITPHQFLVEVSTCGCTQLLQSSVQITVVALPDAGMNSSPHFCTNVAPTSLFAQLGGNPASGGTWSGPSTLAGGDLGMFDPANALPGRYNYTLTQAGCPSTSSIVDVSLTGGPDPGTNGTLDICQNASASNLFAQLGGTPQTNGVWSGPSTLTNGNAGTYNPATAAAGVYTYVVTAAGCPPAVSQVNVTESTIPFAGINTTYYQCGSASTVYLYLRLGGAPDANGTWSGPSSLNGGFLGSFNSAVHQVGTYTYTVENPGCAPVHATIEIIYHNGSSAGLNASLTACTQGSPVGLFSALNGTPHTGGTWSGPSILGNGHWGIFNPQNMVSGTYTYTLALGGCPVANAQVAVSTANSPIPLAEQNCNTCAAIHIPYCSNCPYPPDPSDYINGTLSLNGNYGSGNLLNWYADNNGTPGVGLNGSPIINPSIAQTYWVSQVNSSGGCESQPVQVEIISQASPDILVNQPASQAAGTSVNLAAAVYDLASVTETYRFFDTDPSLGSLAFTHILASSGTPLIGQQAIVTPTAGLHTYWVVADYDAGTGPICHDTSTVEVHITPSGNVNISIKMALEGPMDIVSGIMKDELRARGLLPIQEPYAALGMPHTASSIEQMNPLCLDQTGPNAIVDWVYLELRDSSNASLVISARSALLQRDGDVVDTDGSSMVAFPNVQTGTYYITVQHRNHLGIMTAQPLPTGISSQLWDFTHPNFLFFGVIPTKLVNGKQLMLSGDANGDGQTQNDDIVSHWKQFVGTAGFLRADFDMDGEVQNSDMIMYWRPNVGRGSQIPR